MVRELIRDGRFRVTAITAFELRLGADFLPRGEEIVRMLRARTVPLDMPSALRAGEVFSTLKAAGTTIGMADACWQDSAFVTASHSPPETPVISRGL